MTAPLTATKLHTADLPALAAALQADGLPASDLALPGRAFWRFEGPNGDLAGYGGLEVYGADALLRSITVPAGRRGQGLGAAILAGLLERAAQAGASHAWLLTASARGFFERHGFTALPRAEAPLSIRETEQAARLCAASATLLHRKIPMHVTIYHNPACGTSRNVLAMIRSTGIEPHVIEYLKTPPGREDLLSLIARMGVTVRDVLRQKGTPYEELGLGNAALTDDQLLDAIAAHPVLLNRPIVVTQLGVKLCRPSETVLDILPAPLPGDFRKEDGEIVKPGA